MAIIDLLVYRPAAIFFYLISLPFFYASLSFPSCLAKIILNSLLSLRARKYSKTTPVVLPTNFAAYRPNRPARHSSPNDPIGSRSTGGHLGLSSVNNRRTATIFIRFLAYFPEAKLSSSSLPSKFLKYSKIFHQQPENIQRLFISSRKYSKTFHQLPKIFKDFFARKFVLAANHQLHSGKIQRLFGQQSTAANCISNQQQQSTAAISNNQPAATINQQQQSKGTINTGNNQLSSYQQYPHNPRRLPLVTNTVPSRGYVLLEVDLGLAAR